MSICAIISLALGLFQDFGTTCPDGDPPVDWVEGVAIIVAVLIVIGVGSLNPAWIFLASCDGVFLSGHNERRDESSATGESDAIKKLPYQECIALKNKRLAEFDPDSPIGDGESTSGSPRKNPSGLEMTRYEPTPSTTLLPLTTKQSVWPSKSFGPKSINSRIMMGSSLSPPCMLAL